MAKSKYHYYVLVFTSDAPIFVTDIGDGHMAYWNRNATPYEFKEYTADEISLGLKINGFLAYTVKNTQPITNQPYKPNYSMRCDVE